MITLDGWQVPGYDIKINCSVKIENQDLSGASSYIINMNKGVKGAVVTVNAKIPFVEKEKLAELINKAKALDEGASVIYTLNSDITTAYKVRKATFDGEIKTIELEKAKGWQISFKMREVLSKSEREQQILNAKAESNTQPQAENGHSAIQEKFEKTGAV
ncbi:hypothetical protein Q4489_04445 [Thalassotalea sp. 1_MG-2023]|uniref:baseplate complex protein n=1 Tax=Thalassotalea sp. 1_MG-2023 TaxID=3062680 RepID=UPI0026E310BD|nr:hypothetical protein [Thalassotalea sp. 1_MG-2023]MDO6426247.1 hypothetical protein [Thalassotalea sp. 1_MG-2023]